MSPSPSERARLALDIAAASRIVAPMWPLERFIAVNPLIGLTDLAFHEAVAEARRWLPIAGYPGAHVLADEDDASLRLHVTACFPQLGRYQALSEGHLSATDLVVALSRTSQVMPSTPCDRTVLERYDATAGTSYARAVDAEAARWFALLAERPHGRHEANAHASDVRSITNSANSAYSAYSAWRSLAPHDGRLRRLVPRQHRSALSELLRTLPLDALDAVTAACVALGVGYPTGQSRNGALVSRVDELRGQLARLPGWASRAKWYDDWAEPDERHDGLGLTDVLAIRMSLDALVVASLGTRFDTPDPPSSADGDRCGLQSALEACGCTPNEDALRWADGVEAQLPDNWLGRLTLDVLEARTRAELLASFDHGLSVPSSAPQAQAIFCIDVRSAGLRSHLEQLGPYETLSMAGFFGVAMRYRPLGAVSSYASAPVLVDAAGEIGDLPLGGTSAGQLTAAEAATFDQVLHHPLSLYALAEEGGWPLGALALLQTLLPGAHLPRRASPRTAQPTIGALGELGPTGEDMVLAAEAALRVVGLTSGFAPLVLICGHRATTRANPHAASLDCGACGGHSGAPNARWLATLLNDSLMRQELAARDIDIPDSTWFIAGEHDTTLDHVTLLDLASVPHEHRSRVEELGRALNEAGARQARDRLASLPGSERRSVARRAADWAETRPEWGLTGNAAIVVGPRSITRNANLGTQCFLHSYDAESDVDGTVLETILTAPVVVAQWINAQYYFSTVDPACLGAGDKTLHNPVGGFGVLEGGGGDLRTGIPWQSVAVGERIVHRAVRLHTWVEAPIDRIDEIVERNRVLEELFDGGWSLLIARPDARSAWRMRREGGRWAGIVAHDGRWRNA